MSSRSNEADLDNWVQFEYHWRVGRAEWEQKQFGEGLQSPVFATVSNGLRYLWSLYFHPKGRKNKDFPSADKQPNVSCFLYLIKGSIKGNVKAELVLFMLGEPDKKRDSRSFDVTEPGGWGYQNLCPQKSIQGKEWVVLGVRIWLKPNAFDIDTLFPDPHFQNIQRNLLLYQRTIVEGQPGDITIIVSKKHKLPCHQSFLEYSSPVFQTMFTQPWTEGHTREIHVDDVSLKTLKQLVFYFYVDAMPDSWEENALCLLHAAHKYDVQAVVGMCEKELTKRLSVESAVELLPMAKKLDLELLGMRAVQMLVDNWDQVSQGDRKKLRQSDAILEVTDASASERNVTRFFDS